MAPTGEPKNFSLDKTTQTSFGDRKDNVVQGKKSNSCMAQMFAPSEERYYVLKKKARMVQGKVSTITPESEFVSFLLKEEQRKQDTDKSLKFRQGVSLQPNEETLNQISEEMDAVGTITGQVLVAMSGLKSTDRSCIQASAAMLTSILKKQRNKLRDKVPEIMDIIYFHLHEIQNTSARTVAIETVCQLAQNHTEEVVSSLLRLSLPCDRHVTQIWEALGQAKQPVRLQVLAKLLEVLKRRPCFTNELPGSNIKLKDNFSILPLAATKALCILFRDKKCQVPMNSFYVSVIIFLVIQLHYLVNFPDIEYGQEDRLKTSSYISCAVEALKALIKREKTSWMCFVSLAGGWDLLSSPENYLEGVLLLARAIVKHYRGLDYAVFTKVIPLLHHGDDKQKLTAMAFFTALLSSESTYTMLQKHYILGLLKSWHGDSSPTYRWLGLQGMGNVAVHLQNRKELMALILGIVQSFNDSDEKVTLTAVEIIAKIVAHHKNNIPECVQVIRHLQSLLADVRDKVCCAANRLFRDLLKNLDMKEKSLMQDQVLTSVVPLLLNMYNPHPEVAQNCRDSLKMCKNFLGWTINDSQDSWNVICRHLYGMSLDSIFQHMESGLVQREEVEHLRRDFCSLPSEKQHSVPIVITQESEKVCRYCPVPFRCSRYFPRSCI